MSAIRENIQHTIKALGIVFGDIGTSPLYTFSAIFVIIPANLQNVMGISSLIIWTLILLVMGQYAWLAMSLAKEYHGEGGIIVLRQILVPKLSSSKAIGIATFLSFLGMSLFIGDGVVTPAISILSAVEGLKFIPNVAVFAQYTVTISIIITLALFAFQKHGTERLALAFGPIMLIWFFLLGISGALAIIKYPYILHSISPHYAIKFLMSHGFIGFLLLSKVILCATGAEALYTDMGHLGRRPIISAWFLIVFPALCLIYMGQGAFLLQNPGTENIFYGMILHQFAPLYIPILILSIIATVIASQAMISGLFSVVYQAITTHIMPRLHVEYTSRVMMSQIFIPSVNNFLLVFVLLTIIKFKSSQNLTDAYGIAVSGTMTITATLLTAIFFLKRIYIKAIAAFFLIFVNMLFLTSNLFKIPTGGYWSLLIAAIPFTLIIIYGLGQRRLYKALKQFPLNVFVEKFSILSPKIPHIKGTALFLSKTKDPIPAYIATTMFTNNIIYEENIIVKLETVKTAFGLTTYFHKELTPGLRILIIKVGYLEVVNIDKILKSLDVHPKVIFYGVEDLHTQNPFWKIYIIIKKLTSSFVQFYKFPIHKLHGVQVQVNL
jgi:KUP system potassium uptake protein